MSLIPKKVWRVNPDGEIRDTFRKLEYVFEMKEEDFFYAYVKKADNSRIDISYYEEWKNEYENLLAKIPELPFSNIWMAQKLAARIPAESSLYLGILNSLRAWNFCDIRNDITGFSNTGGFGIDGGISSLIGGALQDSGRLHFEVTGDLAFFYDMNVLGNHHCSATVRILLVNNGKGTEFRNYTHFASAFGDEADCFIAAGGHYGNKSRELVRHYAEDLGFIYLCAGNKAEFEEQMEIFCSSELTEKPIVFEAFTDNEEEDTALKIMRSLNVSQAELAKKKVKSMVKEAIGQKGVDSIKKIMKSM